MWFHSGLYILWFNIIRLVQASEDTLVGIGFNHVIPSLRLMNNTFMILIAQRTR